MAISSRSLRRLATQHRFVSALSAGIGLLFFGLLPAPARAVRLCSLPVVLPFEKGDERFDVVEEKVDAVFRSAGFEMTDSEALVEVHDRVDAEWGEIFDAEVDLWWAPVQSIEDVVADPQVMAAGGFVEVPDGEGTTLLPATLPRMA